MSDFKFSAKVVEGPTFVSIPQNTTGEVSSENGFIATATERIILVLFCAIMAHALNILLWHVIKWLF